jgi:hypothetical protein
VMFYHIQHTQIRLLLLYFFVVSLMNFLYVTIILHKCFFLFTSLQTNKILMLIINKYSYKCIKFTFVLLSQLR